jgi:hypothetical protein
MSDTATEPTGVAPVPTPPAEPAERRFRDLFGARSVVGALVVIGVLSVFAFALPALDDAVRKASGFEKGNPYQVSDTVSFTPAEGWVIEPEGTTKGLVVTASKNGWTVKVSGALTLAPDQSVEDLAKVFRDGDEQSDGFTQVGELESFTTTSGANGVTWSSHGPTQAAQEWDVAQGSTVAQMRADGSAANLASVQGELDAMARSIVITEAAAGAGS